MILFLLEKVHFFRDLIEKGMGFILYQCCRIVSAEFYNTNEIVIN